MLKSALTVIALFGLTACTTDGTAVSGDAPVKAVTKQADANPGDRVCRTEKVTGSRFGTRVCATSEEWAERDAAISAAGRESAGDIARGAAATPPNPSGG